MRRQRAAEQLGACPHGVLLDFGEMRSTRRRASAIGSASARSWRKQSVPPWLPARGARAYSRQLLAAMSELCRAGVFGHVLSPDDGQQLEPIGGVAAGCGGVGDDAQVVAVDGEHVAVQGERPDVWVVDGLAVRFVRSDGTGVPPPRELGA